jgi:hypothetical protein
MKKLELRPKYDSFKQFLEVHGILQETIDACFTKGYFERNPHYLNAVVITKLMHHLGHLDKKAMTVFPTSSSVEFKIVDIVQKSVTLSRPAAKSMALLFNHSYSGPMVGKANGEYLTWEELSEPERNLISRKDYQEVVSTYSMLS